MWRGIKAATEKSVKLGGQEELGERSEGVGKTEFYIVDMCEILRVNKKTIA